MKALKKTLVGILAVSMMLGSLVGCGAKQEAPAAPAESGSDPYKVAVIMMAIGSDFWNMLEEGCLLGGEEAGCQVDVMAPSSESDAVGQVNMIEDCLTKGYDAIVLSPIDSNAVKPVLKEAKDSGVAVITMNSDVAEDAQDLRSSLVGISNYDAAALLAKTLLDSGVAVADDEIAILRGMLGMQAHDERVAGFQEAMEAAGCKVVTVQPADSDRGKAVTVAENILESNPNVKIFYSTNDEMALGSYQAVAGRQSDAKCIGFDGTSDAFKSIIDGKLYGTIAQPTLEMGRQSVLAAVAVLNGQSVEGNIKIDCSIVTPDNVAEIDKTVAAQREHAQSLK